MASLIRDATQNPGKSSIFSSLKILVPPPSPTIFSLKVGSIYWGEIAQGLIQMLPIWDNTLVLTCKKMSSSFESVPLYGPQGAVLSPFRLYIAIGDTYMHPFP